LRDPEALANWPQTLGRDGARTPMPWCADAPHAGFSTGEPWLPVDPAHVRLAVDRQEAESSSILHLTRRLIALRRGNAALRDGTIRLIEAPEPLVAFERGDGDARRLCVFNLGDVAATWPLDGWRILEGVGDGGPDRLPPLSGFIAAPA